jgi:hypothetical protein
VHDIDVLADVDSKEEVIVDGDGEDCIGPDRGAQVCDGPAKGLEDTPILLEGGICVSGYN